jgi:hypothetical protein
VHKQDAPLGGGRQFGAVRGDAHAVQLLPGELDGEGWAGDHRWAALATAGAGARHCWANGGLLHMIPFGCGNVTGGVGTI